MYGCDPDGVDLIWFNGKPHLTPDAFELVRKMWNVGMDTQDIAIAFGVPESAVYNTIAWEGLHETD
jgi:predicted RNA polymerase sigma factor